MYCATIGYEAFRRSCRVKRKKPNVGNHAKLYWRTKVSDLNCKVEQLTESDMQQSADTSTDTPTWQEWAGSDRPEDVLAKLDAVREEVTGGKRMPENSTEIIRASREARL